MSMCQQQKDAREIHREKYRTAVGLAFATAPDFFFDPKGFQGFPVVAAKLDSHGVYPRSGVAAE